MKSGITAIIGFALIISFLAPTFVCAQTKDSTASALFDMSIEDLLNQNVTTVSKTEEKIQDAPGIIEVLTKEDITRFGGNSLSSILEHIPGLTTTTAAVSDRSIIASRGEQTTSTSNHVLLLINGRPVREILEGGINSEMYESFPVNTIERIEVIKGPGSVLYGSNAFSGVINVITANAEKTSFSASALTGNTGSLGASFRADIKTGDLNVVASGRYMKKPNWSVNYSYNRNQINNNPDSSSTNPGGSFPVISDSSTTPSGNGNNQGTNPLDSIGGNNPSNTIGQQMLNQSITIPNESAALFLNANYKNITFSSSFNQWKTTGFDSPGLATWQKSFSNLGYDLKFNEKWNSTFNLSFTNSKFDTDSFPDVHRNSYELLAEWTHFINISQKSKLVVGGLYSYIKGNETNTIDSTASLGIDAHRQSFAFYAQADYQLLKSLKFIAGLQLNKIENIDLNLVPRAGIIWNPTSHLNIKVLYGEAFRAPSLNECYLDQPFSQGNSSLEPEKVGTFDGGVNYTNEHFQFGVNYFHSKLSNIITLDRSLSVPTYENLGTVTFQGAEAEGKLWVTGNLFLNGSLLYQTNQSSDGDSTITPIANFSCKGGVTWQLENGISVNLFDIFQGKLNNSFKTDANVSPESAFNRINLHCNFNLNQLLHSTVTHEIALYLHIDNLLNRQVWLPAWGDDNGKSIPFDQGRVVYAGVNFTF